MIENADAIRAAVEQRFAQVARSPDQEWKFPVGPASAKKLGYDPQEIDGLPTSVTESFCGVGNPLGLGDVLPGQAVLHLGSGPGLDSLLAARRVRPTGRVVGIDLCPEMVEKARRNTSLLGLRNVEGRAAPFGPFDAGLRGGSPAPLRSGGDRHRCDHQKT